MESGVEEAKAQTRRRAGVKVRGRARHRDDVRVPWDAL